MAETNATILIPDISGFTEFMTTTELSHSSYAIHKLINAIVDTVDDEYVVSEIEGDAVLMIKKGPAPSQKEILNICLRIFNAFHLQRNWMQQHTVCPCTACLGISNLTLKFVAHYGPLVEMKVGNFVKHSGTEMIVAHRLMKNSINNQEYVLITEKLLQHVGDSSETIEAEWVNGSEEYASVGKVDYRFMLLNEARKNVLQPVLQNYYGIDNTPYLRMLIENNYKDAYRRMVKIPNRAKWMPGLQSVEQDAPEVYVGSIHYCIFDDYKATVSPLRMTLAPKKIVYAESCLIDELNLSLIYEFVFTEIDDKTCSLAYRFLNGSELAIPENRYAAFLERMKQMGESLKEYCEKMKKP